MACDLTEQKEGIWVISGEIDFHSVIALREAGEEVLRDAQDSVCFDFSEVSSTNTAALSLLLCWRRLSDSLDRQMAFKHLPKTLHSMASVSELESLLETPQE